MRDELLDGELFHSVLEAEVVIGRWIGEYINDRPHRGHGMRTPVAFDRADRARLAAAGGGGVWEPLPPSAVDQSPGTRGGHQAGLGPTAAGPATGG